MLGENHSLTHDFPEHIELILSLRETDSNFADMAGRYHELDKEIRTLELNNVPTSDEHFTELKAERVELKDKLHTILVQHSG